MYPQFTGKSGSLGKAAKVEQGTCTGLTWRQAWNHLDLAMHWFYSVKAWKRCCMACSGSRASPDCLEQKKISSLQKHPTGPQLTWCRCWLLEGHLSWGLHLASGNVVPAAGTATVATAASSPLLPSWLLPSPSAGRQGLTSGVLQVRSFTCSHWTRIQQSILQAGECW